MDSLFRIRMQGASDSPGFPIGSDELKNCQKAGDFVKRDTRTSQGTVAFFCLERTEKSFKNRIDQSPNGHYSHRSWTDEFGSFVQEASRTKI